MNAHSWVSCILGSLCLVILLLGVVFALLGMNPGVYQYLYEKTGVYDVLGETEAHAMTQNVFNFLHHNEELQYFTDDEQEHLADVRNVMDNGYLLVFGAFLLFIFFLIYTFVVSERKVSQTLEWLSKTLIISGIITLVLVVLLGITGLNFTWFFEQFHVVLFPQGNYAFPADSQLIMLFPEGFWIGISVVLGLAVLLGGLVYVWAGYLVKLARHNHSARQRNAW